MKLIKKKPISPPALNLRKFYDRRNKILIVREYGGLGDILMHRMMFEDFKKLHPELEVIFACPYKYHCALEDHPYIDQLIESHQVNIHDYLVSYNTSTACTRHEMRVAPLADEHRSDIWAAHCGVKLQNHNMHISISKQMQEWGYQAIQEAKGNHPGPCVILCPVSAQTGKNLLPHQLDGLIKELKSRNCFICATHTEDIPLLKQYNVPIFCHITIPEWMGLINASDYVISVDTGSFHFAGGIGKPLMGIFTYCDGLVYGKYYDFILVQKHRKDGDWNCGPCYNWGICPKERNLIKPCLSEITTKMLVEGIEEMFNKWPNYKTNNSIKLVWDRKI